MYVLGATTYVSPVERRTPARKAERRTASKPRWRMLPRRRPSWESDSCVSIVFNVSIAHGYDGDSGGSV